MAPLEVGKDSSATSVKAGLSPVVDSKVREVIADRVRDPKTSSRKRVRRKYRRKREKPPTEKENDRLKRKRQAAYEEIRQSPLETSIFSFESLFPAPVWDKAVVERDLYEVSKRDQKVKEKSSTTGTTKPRLSDLEKRRMRRPSSGSSVMRIWRDTAEKELNMNLEPQHVSKAAPDNPFATLVIPSQSTLHDEHARPNTTSFEPTNKRETPRTQAQGANIVDFDLTRKVEESVYGYRLTKGGSYYDGSLVREGAVQFRDGVRLGRPLSVNADRLNFFAKQDMKKGRIEEAQELYEAAIEMDTRDGRAYLGLSRIAQRRRDFKRAKEWLRVGIANSVSLPKSSDEGLADLGGNPYLLQALGTLEERIGNLSEAEKLYITAVKSRPSHAAAWVSLAQLRTRKLRQGAAAGRVCYQTAERELRKADEPASAHVFTAWAALEYKKAGDVRRARELFLSAIEVDPKCSAAWLQLGVMEYNQGNWDEAQRCFEMVLTFDQRNSRVLQAYGIMESKRPKGDSRKAIELFERALKANPRDAGVLQAYALYVGKLGDIESARELLQRGTTVNKRHAPVWQAWGVLETRHGTAQKARDVFQQGIWACAQLKGGQSGGRRCARLWQAWGVLEAKLGDYAAARRCFNRALDADNRNVATITAWTLVEESLGNYNDARLIFERALKQFSSSSDEKMSLWRAYEVMEQRAGNSAAAQQVYQRSIRETMQIQDEKPGGSQIQRRTEPEVANVLKRSRDVEVSTWGATSMGGEIWMKNGSIEGKVPPASMRKRMSQPIKYEENK